MRSILYVGAGSFVRRDFEVLAEHVDLQDSRESVVSIRHAGSQLFGMSCYWVSCRVSRNSVDFHRE